MTRNTMPSEALPGHLVILGAGGFAREVYWYALAAGVRHIVFVDETAATGAKLHWPNGMSRVISDWAEFQSAELAPYRHFTAAVGSPSLRRRLCSTAMRHGLQPAATLVHQDARVYGLDCALGMGGVIAPGSLLTTNITLGDFVVLGVNCTIGHDSRLADYVTCSPGCHVSGNVTLESGVFLGTGACIREKIRVAADVVVGAQGCVVQDIVESGVTVLGVPARTASRA